MRSLDQTPPMCLSSLFGAPLVIVVSGGSVSGGLGARRRPLLRTDRWHPDEALVRPRAIEICATNRAREVASVDVVSVDRDAHRVARACVRARGERRAAALTRSRVRITSLAAAGRSTCAREAWAMAASPRKCGWLDEAGARRAPAVQPSSSARPYRLNCTLNVWEVSSSSPSSNRWHLPAQLLLVFHV
jgi:hypothetical protein